MGLEQTQKDAEDTHKHQAEGTPWASAAAERKVASTLVVVAIVLGCSLLHLYLSLCSLHVQPYLL
jgi:hypothetical protein